MPDARAVWMIPTKVMSWLAMASNLIFRSSSLPLVLWACRMLHAMVPFLAWSIARSVKAQRGQGRRGAGIRRDPLAMRQICAGAGALDHFIRLSLDFSFFRKAARRRSAGIRFVFIV